MSIDYSAFAFPKCKPVIKKKQQMRKKSSKLAYKERKRVSILTDDMNYCFICGRPKYDIHEVFGGCKRQKSMEHGLVIPICRIEHSFISAYEDKLHILGQKKFEETHTREEFINEFGRSYI